MNRFVSSSSLVFLFILGLSSAKELQKCRTNVNCADSGTICKMAANDPTSQDPSQFTVDAPADTTDNGADDAFDPLTADDADLSDDVSDDFPDDSSDTTDPLALIADPIEDTTDAVTLKKGVKVTPSTQTAADGEIKVGSVLKINGWLCSVISLKQDSGSNTKGAGLKSDVLSDFDGSFTPPEPASSDAADDSSDEQSDTTSASQLAVGKIVKMGPVQCKVTGMEKGKPIPTTTTQKPSASTVSPRLSTTRKTTASPKATTAKSTGPLGKCICDEDKRFACNDDDDCNRRFNDRSIYCFETGSCKKDLGKGYCRKKSEAAINDAGVV